MTNRFVHVTILILMTLSLTACSSAVKKPSLPPESEMSLEPTSDEATALSRKLAAMPLDARLAWPKSKTVIADTENEPLYSFVAKNLPLRQALEIFARAYSLNIVADRDVDAILNVEFHDLPFDQAMEALLEVEGLYWQREGQLITVKAWETRSFIVNYIRLVRAGENSSVANVNSGSSEGSGSGEGNKAGAISIKQTDSVEFWNELEAQLETMMSGEGRISVNRMTGTVQVSDYHPRVEEVARYIDHINSAVHRQVDIDVKIVEVALNDDYSLGVDWSQLTADGAGGTNTNLTISDIITQPAGGIVAGSPSTALQIFGSRGDINYSALIQALQEQGEVRTVSQPKIRTLNNQPAMIKVGTDRTFFRREVSVDTSSAGTSSLSQDVAQIVTEGIVLAITPQISTEGWIMMDVSPIVTRVSGVAQVLDENGNVRSSAPNLDIRQASSLVRAQNSETIVIGGLIQEQESETQRSVPVLGRLPILGHLFRGTYKSKVKKELLMFITPRLVDSRLTADTALWRGQEF